ncbi:unnamed protein product, partial [Chrysoparadoxa australica]
MYTVRTYVLSCTYLLPLAVKATHLLYAAVSSLLLHGSWAPSLAMDRSLFKAAANQRARAGSSTKPKYRGKSKAELLALLKAKQAAQEQEKAAPVSPSGSSKPVQPAQPAQPTQAASLPVGFFDQDENGGIQAESSPATQQMQQAWQEQGLEQEGGTISAEGTLPADFFDAPTKSAPQAPKEKRKKLTPEQQADWGEFQTFAAKVNKDEAEEEVGDEAIEMDTKLQVSCLLSIRLNKGVCSAFGTFAPHAIYCVVSPTSSCHVLLECLFQEEREQLEQLTYMGRFA